MEQWNIAVEHGLHLIMMGTQKTLKNLPYL